MTLNRRLIELQTVYTEHQDEGIATRNNLLKKLDNYYREQLEIHQHDLEKVMESNKKYNWQRRKTKRFKKLYIFFINNQYTTQHQTIANSFNNYFINVGSSKAKNITSDIDPMMYVQYYDKSIDIPEIKTDSKLQANIRCTIFI